MTGFVPKEKLTAYQRWEVAAFDEAEEAARQAAARAAARPAEPAPVIEPDEPVILPTAADVERIHNEAHDQGYQAGYAEGKAAVEARAEAIGALMGELEASLKGIEQDVAERLLAVALEVAGQVLRQSLQVKPELILPVVREAVAALQPLHGHAILFAHPDDAALIREQLGELLAHNNWRILDDAALTRGGCRVELGASEVDATLETRWRRVLESIGVSPDWLRERP